MKSLREEAAKINLTNANWSNKRQFDRLLTTSATKNKSIIEEVTKTATEMYEIYNTGTIPFNRSLIKSIELNNETENLKLDKHLTYIIGKSNDPDELLYVWKTWRDRIGRKEKKLFTKVVTLKNIGAREHGYKDYGEYRRSAYEVDDLEELATGFIEKMRPFYLELHGYVRYRLSKKYPKLVDRTGLIPAHLLGNMWAQSWENIFHHVIPYPGAKTADFSDDIKKKLNVTGMFKMAEEFFMSLGWPPLPENFWNKSVFSEPKDGRKMDCHPTAWDMIVDERGKPDVRIVMCTQLNQNDFNTIHHEMGHIYYFLLYRPQPYLLRIGSNPGFHEAVGDTISLSVQTSSHLKKVGLIDSVEDSKEADINLLLRTALERIVFLPFAFLMDKWVWDVYAGKITPKDYNKKWWEYREKYQGIKAPIERTEEDFDPGAKNHIATNVPYIKYFFATILQFTFHKHACKLANHRGPLHRCSIFNSKEAGLKFGEMLSKGYSEPWPKVLKEFTGSDKLSAEPIEEYFDLLITWLKEYRAKENYVLDW